MNWKTPGAPNSILMKKPHSERQKNPVKVALSTRPILEFVTTTSMLFQPSTLFPKGEDLIYSLL